MDHRKHCHASAGCHSLRQFSVGLSGRQKSSGHDRADRFSFYRTREVHLSGKRAVLDVSREQPKPHRATEQEREQMEQLAQKQEQLQRKLDELKRRLEQLRKMHEEEDQQLAQEVYSAPVAAAENGEGEEAEGEASEAPSQGVATGYVAAVELSRDLKEKVNQIRQEMVVNIGFGALEGVEDLEQDIRGLVEKKTPVGFQRPALMSHGMNDICPW